MTTFLVISGLLIVIILGIRSITSESEKRKQPKGLASGMFATMDELFHPNTHEAHIVIEEKEREITPKPAPEDTNNPNQSR